MSESIILDCIVDLPLKVEAANCAKFHEFGVSDQLSLPILKKGVESEITFVDEFSRNCGKVDKVTKIIS